MYRVENRITGPRVCNPNWCQPDRQLLQTLLPAFNDQGIGRRHERAENHLEYVTDIVYTTSIVISRL